MLQFLATHFEHVLCALILLGRVGDVGTTYLATPTLRLEANPIMRKLGWRFAVLTLLLCLIPYYSTALGVMVVVPSLMVSSFRTQRGSGQCGRSEKKSTSSSFT